jgi:Zinc dependent phospholipase C
MHCRYHPLRGLVLLLLVVLSPSMMVGYSILTHEQIVDLAWHDRIEPLLRRRFPNATEDELIKAHAYAYGGCVIQDLGYYPFGSKDFSNLVHYVRSGDFVLALLQDADDLDEYAFALGALAHYVSDTDGHPAVNRSVALKYPKLRVKFGDQVTYEDNHTAHIRTEFGFDVVQVAKNRYTSDSYHNFIGFEVSKPLLEQAFRETYGIDLGDVFANVPLAIGTYRHSVSTIIPEMTRVALLTKRADLVRENPDFSKQKFLYRLSRSEYEREWGTVYQKPGPGARFLAFVIRLLPRIGPLRAVDYTLPSSTTEDLYIKSVNNAVDSYKAKLALLQDGQALSLPNLDFDTGEPTKPGEYRLADNTYAKLLGKLAERHFDLVTPPLRDNILAFYSNPLAIQPDHTTPDQRRNVISEVADLKSCSLVVP